MQIDHPILQFKNVSISYTPGKNAVNHVNADIKKNRITAIMGPSGCGKSTLLRAINRMHELYPDIRISGEILMDNRNILKMNPMEVRRMAGMVFQRPNPFPTMSIFDNVIAGYKLNGIRLKKKEKEEIVETCLTNVGLWNEVKDALFKKGTFLSGGQQHWASSRTSWPIILLPPSTKPLPVFTIRPTVTQTLKKPLQPMHWVEPKPLRRRSNSSTHGKRTATFCWIS
mgnify:CR=1 FL=1